MVVSAQNSQNLNGELPQNTSKASEAKFARGKSASTNAEKASKTSSQIPKIVKETENQGGKRSLNISMTVLMLAAFVGYFTQTQLSTALPHLVEDFQISLTVGQWVTSIFMLTLGVMVPMAAFLTKRFTTRQITIACLSVFVLGSMLAYFSTSFIFLILGRILQAAGTGIIMPCIQVIIFSQLPPAKRGAMMGVIGLVMSASPAIGPTLGGLQTDQFGWRSIFLTLAILGAIMLFIAIFFMGDYGRQEETTIDIFSVILSTLGFGGLIFGFTNIEQYPFTNPLVWGPMLVGVICLLWFVCRQQNLKKREKQPLINLAVLKIHGFRVGTIAISLNFFAFSAFTVLIPIFLQTYQGRDATTSGLVTLPGAFLCAVTGLCAGKFFDRLGARKICITGAVLMMIGSALTIPLTETTSLLYLAATQAIRMAGIGLVMTGCNTWALGSLPSKLINDGTALTNTLRQCVGAIGTPVLVVLTETIAAKLATGGMSEITAGIIGSRWAISFATAFYAILLLVSVLFIKDKKPALSA